MPDAFDAHEYTRAKFDSPAAAAVYRTKHVDTRKDALEKACVQRALAELPSGSHVLDLPSGTGRLTTFLVGLGHRVTAADYSEHMIAQAREKCLAVLGAEKAAEVAFQREDVMGLSFADASFDAVVCNRLMHHYDRPELRRAALAELARVSRGPVVVSFFCSFALSALKFFAVHRLRGTKPHDRIPIPKRVFLADVEAAGLRVEQVLPVRFAVSPQTYVKAVPARAR
jgi:SAM-dependent methyltransferase